MKSEDDVPDPLTFAMDRATIWKAAHTTFVSVGWNVGSEFTVSDVLLLARFLAGDDIRESDDIRDVDG